MDNECWLAAGVSVALVMAAYLLVRKHAKMDGFAAKDLREEARQAFRENLNVHGVLIHIFIWVGRFLPGVVGVIGLLLLGLIQGVCGGWTFEQAWQFLCTAGDLIRGRPLSSCPTEIPKPH